MHALVKLDALVKREWTVAGISSEAEIVDAVATWTLPFILIGRLWASVELLKLEPTARALVIQA